MPLTIVPIVTNLTPEESLAFVKKLRDEHPAEMAGIGAMLPVPVDQEESFRRQLEKMSGGAE